MSIKLRNKSNFVFTDISSEIFRIYFWPDGSEVIVDQPQWLAVSKSGGHRILDGAGFSHYIPAGWLHLTWRAKSKKAHFVK